MEGILAITSDSVDGEIVCEPLTIARCCLEADINARDWMDEAFGLGKAVGLTGKRAWKQHTANR